MDISQIAHLGGVSTYTKKLAEGMSMEKELDIVFFYSSLRKPYKGTLKKVKSYFMPPSLLEPLLNKLRVPIEKFIGDVDIFHSSDWIQPKTNAKKITTYHDVVPLKYPEWSTPSVVSVHRRRLKLVEKEIDMVIAVSETTKKDLLEMTNIPVEKIRVVYEGVGSNFTPQSVEEINKFKKKYRLPEDFILAIGGVGERRNLDRIKRAVKGYQLIISRQDIPPLSDEEMPLLYASAKLLLYPSLYEGFGLPILEAMAVGIPVITSNVSSMPEVGGDAAIYVDPMDESDIETKVKQVINSEKLREELIKKGFAQAKKFTWKKCIDETVSLYKEMMR